MSIPTAETIALAARIVRIHNEARVTLDAFLDSRARDMDGLMEATGATREAVMAAHAYLQTPPGLTGTDPMPYGYRRWNGAIWADSQVDAYNAQLAKIVQRHRAGMPVEGIVNGLYNLARGFDYVGR